jgi:outer membrane protein assembly factor BamB
MKLSKMGAVWCLVAGVLFAQNWPQFRGPGATGVADGMNPPVKWDVAAGTNIAWKTPIPGLAHSSPIVWGDRIYVTTAIPKKQGVQFRGGLYGAGEPADDNLEQSWRLYALDRKTGKIIWGRTVLEANPRISRHPKNSHASSTPATDGRHIVATFGSEGLFAFDTDGTVLWKQDLGILDQGAFDYPDFQWGTASSPIIFKNLAIVQCDLQNDSFLAAFDVASGKPVWRTKRDAIPSWASPTVIESGGRAELVTNGAEYMRGYDPLTGKELWRLKGTSMISVPTPFAANGLIYLFSGYSRYIQPMYAVRPGAAGDITLADGQTSNEHVAWGMKKGAPYLPTPVVYGEYLYTCTHNGILTCLKAKTGERVYQNRVASGAFTASLIAADGRVYVPSEDGDIYVIVAGPEYKVLGVNHMNDVLMATPAISKDMLIVRSQHAVYGIANDRK